MGAPGQFHSRTVLGHQTTDLTLSVPQINLIVGDYFKIKGPLADVVALALEVVKWFNNHSRALGILRDEQVKRVGKYISLILPVLTRWTSHYLSTSRLLDLEYYFRSLVLDSEKRAVLKLCAGAKQDQTAKAEKILKTIENVQFWGDLKT